MIRHASLRLPAEAYRAQSVCGPIAYRKSRLKLRLDHACIVNRIGTEPGTEPRMDDSRIQLLTFEIRHERFGVALDDVREVVRAVSIVRLPKVPSFVEGVVHVRGCRVPVRDIRARSGLPPKMLEPSDHLIIAFAKRRLVALRVDRV